MKRVLLCLVVACATVTAKEDARESRVIQTVQGPVKGYKNNGVFEFFGIPYATAPSGPNRFKAPLPGPVWMHTFEAVDDKIVCPQGGTGQLDLKRSHSMQENCLIANVYIPDTKKTNLPVIVYVHGGAYQLGFGNLMIPKSSVKSEDAVLVTFNYRVGIHGFLCLGTEDAPGNAGMKDQVALLRWVQKNIASFGGNPDDVTLIGSSAGSSAVDLLILSKSTAGLYNKAIPESGANLAVWSVQVDPLENAKHFARKNNFTNVDDIQALAEFYKTASYDLLTSDIFLDRKDSTFVFSPCVERNIGEETFLEDAPFNILKQGKFRNVPVLYGFANMEGLFRMDKFFEWKDQMNERFADFLPQDLKFKSEAERNEVAQVIKEFYFGDKPVGEETVLSYVDYFTDVIFAVGHLRAAQLQVRNGNDQIYLYEYAFLSPYTKDNGMPEFIRNIKGANHCAQSAAVHELYVEFMHVEKNEEYLKVQKTLRQIWLNFILTGKPVPPGSNFPAWPAADANRSPYMDIGSELQLKGALLDKRARFWDDIYDRYYRIPIPPTQTKVKSEL